MSYDLLVWRSQPGADQDLGAVAAELDSSPDHPATRPFDPEVFLLRIAERLPELAGEESGPTVHLYRNDSDGARYAFLALAWSQADQLRHKFGQIGGELDLVVYDPQQSIDTSARGPAGVFVIVNGRYRVERPGRDAVASYVGTLARSSKPGFIVLQRGDGEFVQAAKGKDGLVLEWHDPGPTPEQWRHLRLQRIDRALAGRVFAAWYRRERPPPDLAWLDVTDEIRSASRTGCSSGTPS